MPTSPQLQRRCDTAVSHPPVSPAAQLQRQYTAELVLCCICLAILLGCLLMVLSGMARVKRSGQAL